MLSENLLYRVSKIITSFSVGSDWLDIKFYVFKDGAWLPWFFATYDYNTLEMNGQLAWLFNPYPANVENWVSS